MRSICCMIYQKVKKKEYSHIRKEGRYGGSINANEIKYTSDKNKKFNKKSKEMNKVRKNICIVLVFAACFVGTNVYHNIIKDTSSVSGIILENIEAMAQSDEEGANKKISVYSSSGLCLVVKPGGTYGSSNEVITTNNIWVKCKRIKKQPGIQYEICTPVNCPDGEFHY